MKDIGIYIHIPFCKSKCYYCDFVSFANKQGKIEQYIEALKLELQARVVKDYKIKTIYIGGGTPSIISKKYIIDIMQCIKDNYKIDEKAEITIEVNPNTANKEKLKAYYDIGINRLSIGLQSTNNKLLKSIGRVHTYEDYLETIAIAKEVGFTNINTDIIIGLPKQTIIDVDDTVNKLLKLDLTHISVYSLILEPGTVLMKMYKNRKIELIDDITERKMYWNTKKKLEENGYIHYEISNFAKSGFESKHNMDCWKQKEYLGFGVAASSYENKIRFSNTDNIEEYIDSITKKNPFSEMDIIEEVQDKSAEMKEYMLLGLRKIEGVNIVEFNQKFKQNPLIIYKKSIQKLIKDELIILNNETIKLTKKGIDLANIVWEEFI